MADNKDTNEKKSKFATVLSQLRKERGSSQKKAAADLGISQALLSHYEKGIRECGLDFVIKCSEYYGVTTDYLLGVSKSRYGIDEDYFRRRFRRRFAEHTFAKHKNFDRPCHLFRNG